MAVVISGSGESRRGDIAPYVASGGNLYVLSGGDNNTHDVYKSTDGGGSWTAQDTANAPTWSSYPHPRSARGCGDYYCVFASSSDNETTNAFRFDVTTDLWTTGNSITFSSNGQQNYVSIDVNGSDSQYIAVVCIGNSDKVMGTPYPRAAALRYDAVNNTFTTLNSQLLNTIGGTSFNMSLTWSPQFMGSINDVGFMQFVSSQGFYFVRVNSGVETTTLGPTSGATGISRGHGAFGTISATDYYLGPCEGPSNNQAQVLVVTDPNGTPSFNFYAVDTFFFYSMTQSAALFDDVNDVFMIMHWGPLVANLEAHVQVDQSTDATTWTNGNAVQAPTESIGSVYNIGASFVTETWMAGTTPEIGALNGLFRQTPSNWSEWYHGSVAGGAAERQEQYDLEVNVAAPNGALSNLTMPTEVPGKAGIHNPNNTNGNHIHGIDPTNKKRWFMAWASSHQTDNFEPLCEWTFADDIVAYDVAELRNYDQVYTASTVAWQLANGDVYWGIYEEGENYYGTKHGWAVDQGRFLNGALLDPQLIASPGVPPTPGVLLTQAGEDRDTKDIVFYHAPDGTRNKIMWTGNPKDTSFEWYPTDTWVTGNFYTLDPTNTTDDEYLGTYFGWDGDGGTVTDPTAIPGPNTYWDGETYICLYTRESPTITEVRHQRIFPSRHFPLWTDATSGSFTLTLFAYELRVNEGGTTGTITLPATAGDIETALEGLTGIVDAYVIGSGTQADPWWIHISDDNQIPHDIYAPIYPTNISLTGGDIYVHDEDYNHNYGQVIKHQTRIPSHASSYQFDKTSGGGGNPAVWWLNPSDKPVMYWARNQNLDGAAPEIPIDYVAYEDWNWQGTFLDIDPDFTYDGSIVPAVYNKYPAIRPSWYYKSHSDYGSIGTPTTTQADWKQWTMVDSADDKLKGHLEVHRMYETDYPTLVAERTWSSDSAVEYADLSADTITAFGFGTSWFNAIGLYYFYLVGAYLKVGVVDFFWETIKANTQGAYTWGDPNTKKVRSIPHKAKHNTTADPTIYNDLDSLVSIGNRVDYNPLLLKWEVDSSNNLWNVGLGGTYDFSYLAISKILETEFNKDGYGSAYVVDYVDRARTDSWWRAVDHLIDGNKLHIIAHWFDDTAAGGTDSIHYSYYSRFDISTETFDIENELVTSVTDVSPLSWSNLTNASGDFTYDMNLQVKSDGRVLFLNQAYEQYTTSITGYRGHHPTISERSLGGTWSHTKTTPSYGVGNDDYVLLYQSRMMVDSADRVHVLIHAVNVTTRTWRHVVLPDGGSLSAETSLGTAYYSTHPAIKVKQVIGSDEWFHVGMTRVLGSDGNPTLISLKMEATPITYHLGDVVNYEETFAVWPFSFGDDHVVSMFAGADDKLRMILVGNGDFSYNPGVGGNRRFGNQGAFIVTLSPDERNVGEGNIQSLDHFQYTYFLPDDSAQTRTNSFRGLVTWSNFSKYWAHWALPYVYNSQNSFVLAIQGRPNRLDNVYSVFLIKLNEFPAVEIDHTLDLILNAEIAVDHTFDAILNVEGLEQTLDHTFDVRLKTVGVLDHTFDARLNNEVSIEHTFDVILLVEETLSNIDFNFTLGFSSGTPEEASVSTQITDKGQPGKTEDKKRLYRPTKKVIDRG